MSRLHLKGIAASLFIITVPTQAAAPLWQHPDYVQAIKAARDGSPRSAVDMLEPLHRQGQLRQPLVDDYLTLLVWDKRGDEAIDLSAYRYPAATLGVDTLTTLARYQRDQGHYESAEALYRAALRKQNSATASAGLAMTLADAGKHAEGLTTLDAAAPANSLALARARGYVLSSSDDLTGSLKSLETLLEKHPGDPDLVRSYTTLLVRMGAPHEAYTYLKQHHIDEPELSSRVALDRAAIASRWGQSEARLEVGESRFMQTDRALKENLQASQALHAGDVAARRTAIADRLVILEQRARHDEAIALYQQHGNESLPSYALASAAGAYLSKEQPLEAIRLSKQAMEGMPRQRIPIEWRITLVYAYLEAEMPDRANDEVEILKADVARVRYDASSRQNRYNPDYQQTALLDAMLQAYLGRTHEARQRLDTLLGEAPFDGELRQNDGDLELLRGHPRNAEGIFTRRLVDEPRSTDAKRGLAVAHIDAHRYESISPLLAEVNADAPENRSVRRLDERWHWTNRPQLVIDSGYDLSGEQGVGLDEGWRADTRLYSAPFASHWRVFARYYTARADYITNGTAHRDTAGFGAEYRDPKWQAEAALTGSVDGSDETGGFLAATRNFDDYFSAGLRYERDSDAVPLRARLGNVDGDRLAAEFAYRVDELRRFDVELSALDMSDGNLRKAIGGTWTERWIVKPTYTLDTIVSAETSNNRSIARANYFNPGKDTEIGLTVLQGWLLWRHYDSSFRHRLGLYAGNYRQEGHGSKLASTAFYEHEWRWEPRAGLRYGIAHNVHPYDGDSEVSNRIYLNLDWRF
ncbi:poly-beta-1,6 N-acetyl-D-glucosamine export porin PgaA [Crenobacter cavernae]|uniref:Poly-beta-1,6 N-acetyl-D-glucosamine export porin PgaA n=1 Tax=Crenobacter cavernae TaxID=2290923 RepID=A0A345Y8F1_9NEIS|nr:poly-beta-1,6 N-acetyl-D-glucosamine export porin PgaA [Crenobacter cavernae]AXK40203.1 poly-beta-1,6 N-acetyl-D-glucosamine export porin PgaA [Crenobacter cavernae]